MIRIGLKNKLFIGFGFLFFMIILLWIIGGFFIYDLSNRSRAMLQENYQTVESAKYLILSVDEIKNQQFKYFLSGKEIFDDNLYQQNRLLFDTHLEAVENNITEEGESGVIEKLKHSYAAYISTFEQMISSEMDDPGLSFDRLIPEYTETRNLIVILWDMNMEAISYKNTLLESTAHGAFVFMSLIGTICFIISALFFLRFPRNIARPIGALIKGITEIANRNYSQRLDFQSNDELGELASAFNTMAAKLDEYENSNLSELLFEKKRIDTIINNMKDAIIGINDRNEIIFSNTYASKIIGISESSLIGKDATMIATQNPVFQSIMHDILDSPETPNRDFKPLRLFIDEKVRYFTREILEVNITKTGEDKSTHAGIVIVLKNITHFLEQDEAKTNFMATMSHELKSPISSLRLNLKLLDDPRIGTLNSEQREIIRALKTDTNNMLTITSELLNLAQLETGNIQLNYRKVRPLELFEYVKEASDNQSKKKQINIYYQADPDLPPLYADSEKTAWVLMNLINNAIQYSNPGGQIRVTASMDREQIIFTVEDFGKGIEGKYLEMIFEKFFRVPGSDQQGTGLGLTISKELILKQDGKIWAESEPGSGSRFYFSLPIISES